MTFRAHVSKLLLLTGFCLTVAVASQAQLTEGTLVGNVTDPTGAAVAGANVTITNTATNQTVKATTDNIGFFRAVHLSPGTYQVRVEAPGFKSMLLANVTVNVATTSRADTKLQVGEVREVVEVGDMANLVQTEEGRLTDTLDSRQVQELPLNGREVYQLVSLQPGVTSTVSPVISNTASPNSAVTFDFGFISNGSTPRGNNFLLDGNTNNNEWLGGTPVIFPSVDSIQEVQVQTLNFSAEYGRNNGAIVNVITRSGGNSLHGSALYFHRNSGVSAANFFSQQGKAALLQHLFGFSLGGPIRRDKTFFFVDYEGSRRKDGSPLRMTVETPEFREQVATQRPDSFANQFLTNFPGPACIPGSEFDTGSIPDPGDPLTPGPPDGSPDRCSITPNRVQPSRADQYLVRLDHHFSDSDHIYTRWVANDAFANVDRQELFGLTSVRGFTAPLNGYFADLGVGYTHRFSNTLLNDFRFAYSRNHGVISFGIPPGSVHDALVSASTPDFFPQISFDDGTAGMGGAVFIPRDILFNTFSYADTVLHTVGRHALKYGAEFRNIREDSNYQLETRPFYEFTSIFNFANDEPWLTEALVNRNPSSPGFGNFVDSPRKFHWWQWALFVQDDWKVRHNLTLNLGLRYEVFEPPMESHGLLSNVIPGPGSTLSEQLVGASVGRVKKLFNTDRNNFAPRVGLAWDPTGKGRTAIRSGFSVAYLEPFSNLYSNGSRFDPPDAAFLDVFPSFGVGTNINYTFPVQPSPDFSNPTTANGGVAGLDLLPEAVSPNLRSAYSMQWFLGVQQEFLHSYGLSVNYVGTRGVKLFTRTDPNRFNGDVCGPSACDFTVNRITPGWGQIFYVSNDSNSIYHGLNVQVKKNYDHGVMLVANYTYGKAIDIISDAGIGDYLNTAGLPYITNTDASDPRRDRGLSDFDARHRLTLLGIWDLPSPKKGGIAEKIFGGWQYNWIVALQSGRPFGVWCSLAWFSGCDFNMDGGQNDRPNRPANLRMTGFSNQELVSGIFTVQDFCPDGLVPFFLGTPCVPVGTNGNLGRNTFHGPKFASVDMAIFKNAKITERLKLQFRTEIFNAFNRVNLYLPIGDMASPNFGRSTAAFAPREIQFGMRFLF